MSGTHEFHTIGLRALKRTFECHRFSSKYTLISLRCEISSQDLIFAQFHTLPGPEIPHMCVIPQKNFG